MDRKKEAESKGKEAGGMLRRKAGEEERKTERAKGSDLQKGGERVEERAESADGKRGVKPAD